MLDNGEAPKPEAETLPCRWTDCTGLSGTWILDLRTREHPQE